MTEPDKITLTPEEKTTLKKILLRIQSGMSVSNICAMSDIYMTQERFYHILHEDSDNLAQKYTLARASQAEVMVQEITDIADNCPLSSEAVNKAKLQVAARQWAAAHLKPNKYGDHVQVDHGGTIRHEQLIINRTPRTIEHQPTTKRIEDIADK